MCKNRNFCFYSHFQHEINVKEYFTQRILATTENVHLVVCVHGLDGEKNSTFCVLKSSSEKKPVDG